MEPGAESVTPTLSDPPAKLTLNHISQLQVSDLCSQVILHNFTHVVVYPSKHILHDHNKEKVKLSNQLRQETHLLLKRKNIHPN